jgi:hypothetical protein
MKKENLAIALAIFAIVCAIVLPVVLAPQEQQSLAGVYYDPGKQPSVLPLRDLSATSPEAVSGIIIDYQVVNTDSTPYIGQLVFLNGSVWNAADQSASATMGGKLGIVAKVPATNATADGQILLSGLVRNASWTFTKGTEYYASTVGTFTSSKPSSGSIQPIGWAYNTTVLYFDPPINATANGI